MSEQTEQELRLSDSAKQLINNEVYNIVVFARRAAIFSDFCKTKKDEAGKREELWLLMQNFDAITDHVNEILTTGKMAEEQVKLDNK